jgi:hypothetical protein
MLNLPRRLSHCVLGKEPLSEGSFYVSFLNIEGERKDYCPKCWESLEKPSEGNFWRGHIPAKKKKTIGPDERAFELFLIETEPKRRLILALYLQRRQQLQRRTQTVFERASTGELFDVPQVSLLECEKNALAQEIAQLLEQSPV